MLACCKLKQTADLIGLASKIRYITTLKGIAVIGIKEN